MADFRFSLSPGPASLAGGGAYLRHLTAALAAAGHGVWTDADAPSNAVHVIDGMALRGLSPADVTGAVGLVHHTAALADAAALDGVRAAERALLPLLRRVVATSEPVRRRLVAECGVDPAATVTLAPGVPDAPRSAGSGGPGCTVLSIGALVPRKGHATLLRALNRLPDLPWRLVIVGDAARDPAHAAALHALAGDRVLFAGTLDPDALEAAWQGADLFALATEWEGTGAAIAEALRRGLPVAVTRGGAAADLVTAEAGVVCDVGDEVTLSKSLRRLIFDDSLRADMAQAAWQAGQALPLWHTQARRFVEATCC